MPVPPPHLRITRYRITRPLSAVKLEDQPGSRLRKPTATMVELATGVIVEAEGSRQPSGLITVLVGADAFSVFFDDPQERAEVVGVTAS